ncbi:MAG TPA: hypothetical protein VKD72_30195, partial [Gemmataceae bacterium]|nr:hypothetical protein [Gemmataceae bacterium]
MNRCPPTEWLERLLGAEVGDAERDAFAAHLEECANCQRRLERLTGALPTQFEETLPGPRVEFLARLKQTPPWAAPAPAGWPQPPGYEVLGELGRGGMGVVYKARQRQANRIVALKLIRDGARATAEDRARFRTEAESAARLQHPGIVQVF